MQNNHIQFLKLAFEEAILAERGGTYPIGAVIVDSEGNVISRGRNRVFTEIDCTAHAEVDAIRQASHVLLDITNRKFNKNDFTLYTTCEPCPMCTCTILLSGIKQVVWAADDDEYGAIRRMKEGPHFLSLFNTIQYIASPCLELENKQRKMLKEWNIRRGIIHKEWEEKIKT
ncbi:nucleoside deaminase [Cohnella lubricantis]|uniref:Nucleoside deaminase n=1 Tax=Cohnella lubricantis TaxID=2163172 RepID=A0A841T8H6_9BACL|nr:nucleoside deaminase [Cohnella lubricantis]MBB6677803.1 nucleoside deaminase [Cohnella lubricantis]MBP2120480.1 tRNA(adenine34) deaminase [Cohnella lubricantis]